MGNLVIDVVNETVTIPFKEIPEMTADANIVDADIMVRYKTAAGAVRTHTWANIKSAIAALHYTKSEVDALVGGSGTASSNFSPYDDGFTYLGGSVYYVSYASKIYKFISGTDQTGVTPGSDAAVWEIASASEFTHQQNTDSKLDEGGANEITAAEIKAALSALPTTGEYTPGSINISNTTSITPEHFKYVRIGDFVIVKGSLLINFTNTSANTGVQIDLPIDPNITLYHQAKIVGSVAGGSDGTLHYGSVFGFYTGGQSKARIRFLSPAAGSSARVQVVIAYPIE